MNDYSVLILLSSSIIIIAIEIDIVKLASQEVLSISIILVTALLMSCYREGLLAVFDERIRVIQVLVVLADIASVNAGELRL